MQNPKQRWLILAHAFNMDGRAASQTITDKIPHLQAAGIELVVLSGVSGKHDTRFEHHQLWCAGPAGLRFELRHVLQKRLGKGLAYRVLLLMASLLLLPFMFIEKLLRPVESSWSWWLSAYLKGRQLARQQPFDLIYSTGGAFAAHVAARALKQATGTPWLAEVHDPFVTPCVVNAHPTAQQRMQARVEQLICRHADVAVWFTNQALTSALARNPQLGNKGRVVLPGVDKPFKDMPPYQPTAKMVVGHFGSLSATRNLTPMFKAMELLHASNPAVLSQLVLHITGGPLDEVSAAYLQGMKPETRQAVQHLGRIEHDPATGMSGREQILRRMRATDVLLLLHGQETICAEYMPSKMYEYLWMQRPILATVHLNPQMNDILQTQGHRVVNTSQQTVDEAAKELAKHLDQLLEQWATTGLPDSGLESPYATAASVGQLIGWAREVTELKALKKKTKVRA